MEIFCLEGWNVKTILTKEAKVLLQCCDFGAKPEDLRLVLSSPLDWERLTTQAAQLSLGPYLYMRLKEQNVLDAPPETFGQNLKGGFLWSQSENMKRFAKVQQILQALSEANIPVIVLKGAAVASLVYPHLGCRPMGDIDLLIRKPHLDKAEEILEALGFQADEQTHSKQWFREFHHHLAPYISRDRSLTIELHHHIVPLADPVKIPINVLWDRAVQTSIANVPCRVLSPEDMIIHACHHLSASNQFLGQLRGLCDVAHIIRHYKDSLDWTMLCDHVKEFGLAKHAYYSLWLAKTCIEAPVPSDVLQTLASAGNVASIKDWLFKFLIRRAILIFEANQHLFYLWALQDTCSELLSQRDWSKKCQFIYQRKIGRFKAFAQSHAQSAGSQRVRDSMILCYARYVAHLVKKACGMKLSSKL